MKLLKIDKTKFVCIIERYKFRQKEISYDLKLEWLMSKKYIH